MADLRLDVARRQIEFARSYSLELIENVPHAQWFEMPAGLATHLAWQVGHLAMAEYGLALFRQRGRKPEDLTLMSSAFRKLFSRGSQPLADAAAYPPPSELLEVLHAVHRQVLGELPGFPSEQLDEPAEMPYAGFPTKYGALLFCPHHEMLHAGQIGLLRRALGHDPLR